MPIDEKDLENFIIHDRICRYNPGFVAKICKEFGLNWRRVRAEIWKAEGKLGGG